MGWINSQGYNMIYKNGKEIREHRLSAEEALGVPIPEDILVHHIDGNKLNNDVLNLQLITREEHPKVHYTGVPRTQEVKNKVSQSKMGHTVSEETRRKISKTLTGRKQSKEAIAKKIPNIEFDIDEITMLPKEKVTLAGEDLDTFKRMLDMLEEIEDVQTVYHNVEL